MRSGSTISSRRTAETLIVDGGFDPSSFRQLPKHLQTRLKPSLSEMPTTTPQRIDKTVIDFCRGINNRQPEYVPVFPEQGAKTGECFHNVLRQVERKGGAIEYGWHIAIWPSVYIEGEHHAIWRTPDGRGIDVTPPVDGVQRILFLPDPERVYDYAGERRLDNVRKALTNDPDVREFLALAAKLTTLIEDNSKGLVVSVPREQLAALYHRQQHHYRAMLRKFLGRNDPCPCGSGQKYKKCCMGTGGIAPYKLLQETI